MRYILLYFKSYVILCKNILDLLLCPTQLTFVPEQVEQIALEVVENVLKDKSFHDHLVQGWIDDICAKITLELIQLQKPFKYIGIYTIIHKSF
jgi:hypothetical protein